MRYTSSEAYELNQYDLGSDRGAASYAPSFDVLEGGGLDAHVRKGVSERFLARVKLIAGIAVVFLAISFVRITLTTMASEVMDTNVSLETQVSDATELNKDLKVSKAVLNNSSRIDRLATQQYGMYRATSEVLAPVDDPLVVTDAISADTANLQNQND